MRCPTILAFEAGPVPPSGTCLPGSSVLLQWGARNSRSKAGVPSCQSWRRKAAQLPPGAYGRTGAWTGLMAAGDAGCGPGTVRGDHFPGCIWARLRPPIYRALVEATGLRVARHCGSASRSRGVPVKSHRRDWAASRASPISSRRSCADVMNRRVDVVLSDQGVCPRGLPSFAANRGRCPMTTFTRAKGRDAEPRSRKASSPIRKPTRSMKKLYQEYKRMGAFAKRDCQGALSGPALKGLLCGSPNISPFTRS